MTGAQVGVSPWDIWAGWTLVAFGLCGVVAVLVAAVADARNVARHRRIADRQDAARRWARPGKGAMYGVCGEPLCTSGAVVAVGPVWFCFDHAHGRLAFQAGAGPFDQQAAAAVDQLEQWANTHRSAS